MSLVSPALTGGFFTITPPGNSPNTPKAKKKERERERNLSIRSQKKKKKRKEKKKENEYKCQYIP